MEIQLLVLIGLIGGIIGFLIAFSVFKHRIHQYVQKISEMTIQLQFERENGIKLQSRLEEQEKSIEETKKTMKDTFDSLASNALQTNNQMFLTLAKETLESYIKESKGDLDQRKKSIEEIIKPLKDSLDKHEQLVSGLRESSKQTFGNIQTYISGLKESQDKLTNETHALVSALKDPRVRGKWGEIGLKRIVEFSGMNKYCDFVEQESQSVEDGRLRPDLIVNLPENRRVIVDAKLPLSAYLEALESKSEETREQLLNKYAKDVRDHMIKLSKKEYWAQFPYAVDFVVLYMEIESAFGTAFERDRNLIIDGINNNIMFATPTTLITLLRTVAFSWKQQAIAENANEIWKTGTELHERLKIFANHLMSVGKGLDTAAKSYNNAIGSWENRIMPSTRRLEELGASKEKDKLPENKYVETNPRELKEN